MKSCEVQSAIVSVSFAALITFLFAVGLVTAISEVRVESYENGWREGRMNLESEIWHHQVDLCVDGDMTETTYLKCAEKATQITQGWEK